MAKKTTASASPAAAMAIAEAPADTKRRAPQAVDPLGPEVHAFDAGRLLEPTRERSRGRSRRRPRVELASIDAGRTTPRSFEQRALRAEGLDQALTRPRRRHALDTLDRRHARQQRLDAAGVGLGGVTPQVHDELSGFAPARQQPRRVLRSEQRASRERERARREQHERRVRRGVAPKPFQRGGSRESDLARALLLHRPAALGRTSLVAAARRTTIGSCVARKHGRAARGLRAEQIEHDARLRRVEVASRLVGENHVRLADDGASERDALLLAAGEQLDPRRRLFRQSDRRERLRGPPPRFAAPRPRTRARA